MSCIQIDIPQSRYKAGDTVSGFVSLVSKHTKGQEVDVGSITIEFTGTSNTATHWHRIPPSIRLVFFHKTLFTGPKRLHVSHGQPEGIDRARIDLNQWPFSFILPFNCTLPRRYSVSSSPYFNPDPNQPLPISFVDEDGHGVSCSIVYELQATLRSPIKDGYYTNGGTKKMELFVHRPRSIEQPTFNFNTKSAIFTYRSLLLLPREERKLAHRPPTIKEKLKLKTSSTDHLPKAVFTIRVQTPSAAVIGQPLPLMLHVDYDVNSSTVPPPIFHLKRVSIHLCEETSISGLNRVGELESTRWTRQIIVQQKEFVTQGPRVEEHQDLREVIDTTVSHDGTPTFKTFNVARTYSLKVFAGLESPGKVHLVFSDYKPCTLLAEDYDGQIAAYHEPAPITDDEEIDPPPPYDFVSQEAVPEYSNQPRHTGQHENGHTGQIEAAVVDRFEHWTAATASSTTFD